MKAMVRTTKPVCAAQRRFRRLDTPGAAFLAVTVAALLAALFTIAVPNASAGKHNPTASASADQTVIDGKFKGHLPITELTEDQAILHALKRLAYGPRPGDVERVRQMGLAKWIDQQPEPNSIGGKAVEARRETYPTLRMSSAQALAGYPHPKQAEKQAVKQAQAQGEQRRTDAAAASLARDIRP